MTPSIRHMAVPALLVGAVLMMVVPLPAVVLDLLLAFNITCAVVIMLGVMTLTDTLELSVFPSLLLTATLIRLALNVSSTRLILLDGYAGKVIETFGNFVVGGSVVVGLVVFLILVIIQFVVVTNGAGRVAEVAARFTLDAMPGKQMAIDADLSAGLIDEHEARQRRDRIEKESEFYGAMDGASKFVKGDAIAGIIIVVINLIGGFAIGMAGNGMTFGEAASTYSLLTVGDGLVSQIPALLISVAAGLLVTRVRDDEDLGPQVIRQLLGNPRALRIAGFVVGGFALLPGLPKLPFIALGAGLLISSSRAARAAEEQQERTEEGEAEVTASSDDPEALISEMRVEPLELHLAYDVLDLIDPNKGGDLLERVRALRRQVAMDLGIVMPFVRTRDDVSLPPSSYRILLHGVEVANGTAPKGRVLALPAGEGDELVAIGGDETREPVFGLPAYWVPGEQRAVAAAAGATVVDRSSVIVTHLAEVVRSNAAELLSRQHVQMLVDGLRYDEPLLAGEVGSEHLPIALVHEVLRRLLTDRVPIRDLGRIIEALTARTGETRNVEQLASAARVALGAVITERVAGGRTLAVLTLEPGLETSLHEALRDVDGTLHVVLDPSALESFQTQLEHAVGRAASQPHQVAVVCGQMLRAPLARLFAQMGVDLSVLAYPELPPHVELDAIGVIGDVQVPA